MKKMLRGLGVVVLAVVLLYPLGEGAQAHAGKLDAVRPHQHRRLRLHVGPPTPGSSPGAAPWCMRVR